MMLNKSLSFLFIFVLVSGGLLGLISSVGAVHQGDVTGWYHLNESGATQTVEDSSPYRASKLQIQNRHRRSRR